MLKKILILTVFSVMVFVNGTTYAAPVIQYGNEFQPWVYNWTDPNDLLQTSLASTTTTGNFNQWGWCPLGAAALNDGIFYDWPSQFATWTNNAVVEYYLDTSVNTNGYDVNSIDTYGGWNDSGRDAQQYSIYYSRVGSASWILFDSVDYNPAVPVSASLSHLAWSCDLKNIDAIKFVAPAAVENGSTGMCEIDVIGTPSTQPPVSTVVNAGADQDVFLVGGIVDVSLNGTVTTSVPYTVLWSVVSKPAGSKVVFTPGTTVEDPAVRLNMAGAYVLKLTATDGDINPSATVTIGVFDASDTGVTIDLNGVVTWVPSAYYTPWTVATADLLQTHLASTTAVGTYTSMPNGTSGGVACLTNGFFGLKGNDWKIAWNTDNFPELCMMSAGNTLDYFLDTSVNTLGYDITNIRTYGGWQDGGRDQQNYQIWYSVVGSANWILFDSVKAEPASVPGGKYSAIRVVTPASLVNVDAIRFVVPSDVENGWTAMGEIDVFGTPSAAVAPLVDAGANQTVWLDGGIVDVSLNGTVTSSISYTVLWSVLSQPAGSTVVFTPATADVEDPAVRLDMAGTYVLKLTAVAGAFTPSATVTVTIYADACAYAQAQPGFAWNISDLNYDCVINMEDFAELAANWLECYHPGCL